jgi:hypothetical protein
MNFLIRPEYHTESKHLNFNNTGISKILLIKGGHGLGNVRLNLFRMTISSYWLTSTFFMSHKANCAKHTNTICKECIKILRHYCKVREVLSKIYFGIGIQKMI